MKIFSIVPITLLLILGCTSPIKSQSLPIVSDSVVLDKLFTLSESQNYFELKPTYNQNKEKLSEPDKLYFISIIENAFSNPRESNIAITKLEDSYPDAIADSLMQTLYLLKTLNHTKLYEYGLAAQNGECLLKKYADVLDSSTIVDIENTNKIWIALKDVPKQEVIRNQDFTIPISRDIAGLYNISTSFTDTSLNFIFDTGANFSTIRRSLVNKLGMKLIKSDFMVGSSTGEEVKSDLAIAENFNIGGITIKNAVFLVINDEDLSFPGYNIYGIIGYPIIEAMKEIHITKDNKLFVPKNLKHYSNANFALDGMMPVVEVKHEKDNLIFIFDTGNNHTDLFPKYLKKYKKKIESTHQRETLSSGSVGGMVEFEGYKLPGLTISIANSEAELVNLLLRIDDIGNSKNNFYGSIGQDFIKQFDKMIISFEHSSILFE